ncbi:SDR family NAD(P)-dependent oxidoreductase [Hyphococcus sp.]|jgi:short-subunit dehydrogenase|uniref:SDR family NAD(P)-dependent oxidoreductase n=1 Tax=Hyphococcus sp. TaxID=2038636 RepID=UPI003D0F781F
MRKPSSVIITGASSGIGKALALHYLRNGAFVGVCGRNEARLCEIYQQFPKATPLVFDVTDRESASSQLGEYIRSEGTLDLVVLNAGDHRSTDGIDFNVSDYTHLMRVNYFGIVNCLEPVIEAMTAQRSGVIALMGSLAGRTGLTHAGAYCASKAAVLRLAETLHVELEGLGIDVRLISPGFVKTPLTDRNEFPMPFLMSEEEAVKRIWRGLETNRFEIAFPARLALLIRLLSLLPRPLYFRALRGMLRKDRDV